MEVSVRFNCFMKWCARAKSHPTVTGITDTNFLSNATGNGDRKCIWQKDSVCVTGTFSWALSFILGCGFRFPFGARENPKEKTMQNEPWPCNMIGSFWIVTSLSWCVWLCPPATSYYSKRTDHVTGSRFVLHGFLFWARARKGRHITIPTSWYH